ncbi:hypothetical protein AKO1_001638 [Acrasis kona]|uniref:C2H2-type domain-containing protein n=1 Tax=Acrasis kona TaxID=1008807 RepID=A0AAW2ZBI6_9EUKA
MNIVEDEDIEVIEPPKKKARNAFSVMMTSPKRDRTIKHDKDSKLEKQTSGTDSKYITCPLCQKDIFRSGMGMHMMTHDMDKTTFKATPKEQETFEVLITNKTRFGLKWNCPTKKRVKQTKLSFLKSDNKKPAHRLAEIHYKGSQQDTPQDTFYYYQGQKEKLAHVKTFALMEQNKQFQRAPVHDITLTSKQQDVHWSQTCKLRLEKKTSSDEITLKTDYDRPVIQFDSSSLEVGSSFSAVYGFNLGKSFLKSLLQKNIRLGRAESAVRVAKLLIQCSVTEFLRRMLVIIVEDAILHPAFAYLTWLMMADSRGFIISIPHLNNCLRIVNEVCHVQFRDEYPDVNQKDEQDDVSNLYDSCSQLHPFEAMLVRSLLIRALFGGMTGDCRMLKGFAELWFKRFCSDDNYKSPPSGSSDTLPDYICDLNTASNKPFSPWMRFILHCYSSQSTDISFQDVGPITHHDIVLSALDQHCSPISTLVMQDSRFANAVSKVGGEDEIKTMMWYCRSSLNTRRSVYKDCASEDQIKAEEVRRKYCDVWEGIASGLDTLSNEYIKRKL